MKPMPRALIFMYLYSASQVAIRHLGFGYNVYVFVYRALSLSEILA